MKAYGHSRTDKNECSYRCCTSKSGKKNCRDIVDKVNRKTARQQAKAIVHSTLFTSLFADIC